jgi:hypothetical protein
MIEKYCSTENFGQNVISLVSLRGEGEREGEGKND